MSYIFKLGNTNNFPPASQASEEGLLAFGGDLKPERLLRAYREGIFPWFEEGQPYLWWSPDPRLVLFPDNVRISKSMRKVIRDQKFDIKFDHDFKKVIQNCAVTGRKEQDGTWITNEMIEAYTSLHALGYAHSVEAYEGAKLVGGLYGIAIGKVFFGESMFHHRSNASKVAFIELCRFLLENDFQLIDAQQDTSHLRSFGAQTIRREMFLDYLEKWVNLPSLTGKWSK